jgi:tetratricopeptide (TPR) repeat protein
MKKILILLSSAALLLTNCQEDFLEQEPSGMLSTDQLNDISKKDPASVLSSLVSGLYSTTFVWGSGGIEGHDDFGQKSVDITTDFMTGDFGSASTSYGWFMNDYNFTSQIKTSDRAYMLWRYYNRLVKSANEVLDIIGDDITGSEAYYGQAKAMRAYSYFYLVNLYQHPYSEKKDAPGVPVYTTQLVPEIHGQSKVSEVYELIISDLEDAAEALKNFDRGNDKSKINRYVALGLLANAYLFRGEAGDYQKAAAAAKEVIDSGRFPLMSEDDVVESGFNSISIPSWMWGIDLTADNSPALPTFWGHVDYYTYSYSYAGNMKIIDEALYESIPASDIRKYQFGSPSEGVGISPLAPIYKFYDSDRIPGKRLWENDEVYMRVEEMYLILAEAYARDNKTADAAGILKRLLDERDPSAANTVLSLSNSDLLEAIYFNWRVEMWGEGKTYFAMKRYKKTVQRGQNHVYRSGERFAYNYEYMIFAIPEREELNNPYLVPQQ